jgi:hypothetical protein
MAMAAYIIGMQRIASLASPKKRVVEQGFLEFKDDGQTGSYRFVGLVSINACVDRSGQLPCGGDWEAIHFDFV